MRAWGPACSLTRSRVARCPARSPASIRTWIGGCGHAPPRRSRLSRCSLMPGIFARLRLTLRSAPGATVVPVEAVLRTGETEASVFVVHDGKAQRRQVRTGMSDGGLVQVLEGLEPGQQVIVGGLAKLKDGMAVSASPIGGKTPPAGATRPAEAKS
ncbi:MAG: hypothetical protein MZV70_30105 [Desulfobacterales bacterium]|nr:hypothetical protein [Desulfobacterales bacterium]